MNKKLLAGFSMLVTVGAFWACGDGSINKMDVADELMATQYNSGDPEKDLENSKALKDKALKDCENDPICKAEYADYLANPDAPPPTSSEGSTTPMSASSNSGGGTPVSSSSHFITAVSSASETGPGNLDVSSSSEAAQPVTGLGSCAPEKTPISKGESVAWVFKGNGTDNILAFNKGEGTSLTWSFDPAGTVSGEASGVSVSVTYSDGGVHNASVVATKGVTNEEIKCAPLQVNGAAITCTCNTDVKSPYDYSQTPTVSWKATCSSEGANITGYKWSVAEGTAETGTFTFTEAKTVAPKVVVSNDDGTETEFNCTEIKGTNGPENEFDLATATDEQKSLKQGQTYTITHPYSAAIQFNGSSADCSIELNGESVTISHYKAFQPAPASPITVKPENCTATIGGY